MSLLALLKNSLMLLLSPLTSNFAASRPSNWHFSASSGGFCFLEHGRGITDEIGFKAQMNSERDYRHLGGRKLEGIAVKININSGRCILGSIVPK
jgi:hypothetical protein